MSTIRVRLIAIVVLAASACCCRASAAPPNVLLIVVDDLNCALGCYGHPIVRSPNIDRLAARGVQFDRAYCNYPVCNASRTSFLSGRRPETTQVYGNGVDPRLKLGEGFQFLPEYFRTRGYFAAGVGKVPHTPEHIASIRWDYYDDPGAISEDEKKQRKREGGSSGKGDLRSLAEEEQPDHVAVVRAVEFLEEPRDKPLFLAVGLHRPHGPRVAPQKYLDLYPPDKLPALVEPPDHLAGIPKIANPPQYEPDLSLKKQRSDWQTYYGCVTFMDAQVGVLLEALDRLKSWDNTIVVFFSDHGVHLGEHGGFLGKQSLMEESVRVPLIVWAPGCKAGAVSPRLVELVDVFPTLTELCRLPADPGVEGESFAPLLSDPQRPWKQAVFAVAQRGKNLLGRSVRTEQFTFIQWPDGSRQLYDHQADPKEYVNLAEDPQHAAEVAALAKLLHDGWQSARVPPRQEASEQAPR